MFAQKVSVILVVHNDEVLWIDGRQPNAGGCLLRLPLEQFLNGSPDTERISRIVKGNYKTLWIVPDHWLGMENYAFSSTRASLIEPFLERKLAAAYSNRRQVLHFFGYRSLHAPGAVPSVMTYFLQEEKGFGLYERLVKMNLAPRNITCPGFIWGERLHQLSGAFDTEGTLMIHMGDRDCMLYFYYRGIFLFSRHVALSDDQDRIEALTFEINQSLYMFSQKTKNELNRIFLLAGPDTTTELLGQALGREVIVLASPVSRGRTIPIPTVPFVDALLKNDDLSYRVPFSSLTHRQARRELDWAPVQWAGILIGTLLLAGLIGANLLLSRMHSREETAHAVIAQQLQGGEVSFGDHEQTLDRMLEALDRPLGADTLRGFLGGLPAEIELDELTVTLERPRTAKLGGTVRARDADELKALLDRLVARVKADLKPAPGFSINAIEVAVDLTTTGADPPRYRIAMRLELT